MYYLITLKESYQLPAAYIISLYSAAIRNFTQNNIVSYVSLHAKTMSNVIWLTYMGDGPNAPQGIFNTSLFSSLISPIPSLLWDSQQI